MSTITAILEPNADGTLHLPLPPRLRGGKVKVVASLEAVDAEGAKSARAKAGLWKNLPGPFWMAPDFDAPLEDFKDYMG